MRLKIQQNIGSKKYINIKSGSNKINIEGNKLYTPKIIGYNLAHFNENSNILSWLIYSNPNGARLNINPNDIEPSPTVDNTVTDLNSFNTKKNLVRSIKDSANTYINWTTFTNNYNNTTTSDNYLKYSYVLTTCLNYGLETLVNITASLSLFPITNDSDWTGKWTLWRHFYAQAFILARDYGVANYSIYNEPNNVNSFTEDAWKIRYIICSDAIQCALQDVNSSYNKNLKFDFFAPNTANGATKYNSVGDVWGSTAVLNRRINVDGSTDSNRKNLTIYNYQKYNSDGQNFIDDFIDLKNYVDKDTYGDTFLGTKINFSLTEFNVRTSDNYDNASNNYNLDRDTDFPNLATNCIALSINNIKKLYLFKFGQTADVTSNYKVKKNGTHYVQNSSPYNYGGITKGGEVFRLFKKCAGSERQILDYKFSTNNISYIITKDNKNYYIFASNKNTSAQILSPNLNILDLKDTSIYIEEVSNYSNGEIRYLSTILNKTLSYNSMPAKSVWAITVPINSVNITYSNAVANSTVTDGTGKNTINTITDKMTVRSDGSQNNRNISLIKFNYTNAERVNSSSILLELNTSTISTSNPSQANIYNVTTGWNQNTATFANLNSILKQNVGTGLIIENNVVTGYYSILGQITATGTNFEYRYLDVTNAIQGSTNTGFSCLISQDHRYNNNTSVYPITSGDLQSDGLYIKTGARLLFLT